MFSKRRTGRLPSGRKRTDAGAGAVWPNMNRRTATTATRPAGAIQAPTAQINMRINVKRPRNNSIVIEQVGFSIDPPLFLAILSLLAVGIFVAYVTSYHSGFQHLGQHLLRIGIGIGALIVGVAIPHRWYGGWMRWLVLGVGLGLLVATLLFGQSVKGADRWLELPFLPFPIQPAEFAKFALPFWLAAHFAELTARREPEQRVTMLLILPVGVLLAFLALTLSQPAIGTTAIMAVSAGLIFVLAGVRVRYLLLLGLIALAAVAIGVLVFPHGLDRLTGFLTGRTWHQEQSIIAIARGRLWGQWLIGSKQAVFFLPEVRTDFAVAAVCEEFGFFGTIGIFGLYGLVFWRGMSISRRTAGLFGRYLAAGITLMIVVYALVHIGVAVGAFPTTGQPLPFISYGGSAMIANLFAIGVLLNISRFERRIDEAHNCGGWNGGAHTPGAHAR